MAELSSTVKDSFAQKQNYFLLEILSTIYFFLIFLSSDSYWNKARASPSSKSEEKEISIHSKIYPRDEKKEKNEVEGKFTDF